MQTKHVAALIVTIAVIALALGVTIGYTVSSGRTSTTETGKTSRTTYTLTTSVFPANSSTTINSTESSQALIDTTFTTNFYYSISINYGGAWTLEYLGTNGTINYDPFTNPIENVRGSLNGTGNYETTVVTYGVEYVENQLCVTATKVDPQNNLTLTLKVVAQTNSTTSSNPTAMVCWTQAV